MKKDKNKEQKMFTIAEIVIGAVFILLWIICIIVECAAPDTAFTQWIKTNVWDVDKFVTSIKNQIPVIISCVIYIVLIIAICKILRTIFKAQMKKSNRTKTVITLLDGFIKYGCAIALIICVLKACGVNTAALIASVGVLTLVVGLGAQSLIADIIAGMFIIFENEYNVGEIISIDDFRGTVIEIGIRSTKLIDAAGNIKIINNSDISNIVNMSRELSLAVVDCEFPYDVPLEFIENILNKNLESIKEHIPAIVEGPYYKGVSYYGESNVAIKIVAKCNEEDRYQVQRDLLREYRILITNNGIDLSYPQIVINTAKAHDVSTSEKLKRDADKFVNEQKKVSKNIEDQDNNN